jgi:two-component sensor histidine kinase
MWITAIPAHMIGILDGTQFRGVTLAIVFLVLMNPPLLWIAERLRSRNAFERLSIAVHGCEVLGYTAVIHFVGGLDAAFLTAIYCGLIVYVGVVAPRRHLFLVAGMSAFAFCALVMLEHVGVLRSYPLFGNFPSGHPPWIAISVVLAAVTALLFVVAIICARSSGLLRKSREDLRLRSEQLQREIEARKRTEAKLRTLVDEKQLLLQEVHHRVKNNLQVISSLLKLQAEGIPDAQIRTALATTRGRVESMAMVHEMFYRSGELDQVDLEPFLRNLSAYLVSAHDLEHGPVEVVQNLESVKVGLETAIRVGLIVNELITNSLKHAFPATGPTGRLELRMSTEAGSASLTVADNGPGLPPDLDPKRTETLGLQLIHNLARQLRAELRIEGSGGASFHLRFPVADAAHTPVARTA